MNTPAWVIAPADGGASEFAAALGISQLTAALLRRRGLSDPETAHRFLHPRLEDLSAPGVLPGMDMGVRRVVQAIAGGHQIAIHGDYDVDGISATAILLRGLRALGVDPVWYLPHRLHDGYGLGTRAVETLAAQGARLLIAADCGITAHETVAHARSLGLDVIILDHHIPSAERPAAVIVEPAGWGEAAAALCAAGLALMFIVALRGHLGMTPAIPPGLVSLAALGTVADVVPLREDNRRLVAAGLSEMCAVPLPGLKALADVAGTPGLISTWHVGWQLAPRLNAPGRLGDPAPALRLLLTDDATEARALAQVLDDANRQRQELLERTLEAAIEQAEEDPSAAALVVAGDGWHPGVVGLVAGRLAERYRRPTVAIGLAEAAGRGSARSVPGFNLIDALGACQSRLLGFGGHARAAGLTITREEVPEFRRALNDLAAAGAVDRAAPTLLIDADVRLRDVTADLVTELERLGPFGEGNPEPVLAVRGVRALNRRVIGDGRHLRLDVSDGTAVIEAIGFAMAEPAELLTFTDASVDLAVVPEHDPLRGDHIRLRVVALDVPGVDPERMLADTGALVDRLFSRAADYLGESRHDGVEDAPAFYTKAVGVTFDGRQETIATLRPGDRLVLFREPANPHDPHAVQVATRDGRALGYLRAQLAGRLAPSIDAGVRYRASVTAVTGGGDRSLGINILVEREDSAPCSPEPESVPVPWTAWARLGGQERVERVTAQTGDGHPPGLLRADALSAVAAGSSIAITLPPGKGVATALASVAALAAGDRRCALVVAPLRRQVLHRGDQIGARLSRLGLRVRAVHGLQNVRERERIDAMMRAGEADVVVASWEVASGGWAQLHADRIAAVVCDGVPGSVVPTLLGALPGAHVCLVNTLLPAATMESVCPGAVVVRDEAVRTGLRLIDRRGAGDTDAVLEEVINRDEKCVIYADGREPCVRLAMRLRERCGRDGRLGYLHAGLPVRVRQIVTQAFRENRLRVLVATSALDEELLPEDVRHVVMTSIPPDRERFAEALGATGFGERPVTVTLLWRPEEIPARRRALDERIPQRSLLATLYRVLARWRGDQPFSWPDDATWAHLSETLPELVPSAVKAALAIFEEAGVAVREGAGDQSEVRLIPTTRRDLATSLRYREGRREREAFEASARWAVRASSLQVLQVAAGSLGTGEPAGAEAGAGR